MRATSRSWPGGGFTEPRSGLRSGVILVLALVIALVLAVLILTFHTTAMQGKLEVSRSYVGDAALFLAESIAEEGLAAVERLANRPDSPWYIRFQEATREDNDKAEPLAGLITASQSELATELGATLSARARIIVLNRNEAAEPREKVGSIEVEGKAHLPLGRKNSLTRRVTVRRDFKCVYLTGQSPLSDYTLFVRDARAFKPLKPADSDLENPLLVVKNRRTANSSRDDSGAVYIGLGAGTGATAPIQLLTPGRRTLVADEISYLQGVKVTLSPNNPNRYQLGKWDPVAQTFVDEDVGQDNARAIVADAMKGMGFNAAQIETVRVQVLGAKMRHKLMAADPRGAGLDIYVNDPGKGVEGNVFYPYWFKREFDFVFSGPNQPKTLPIDAAVLASAASFLAKDPNASEQVMGPLGHCSALGEPGGPDSQVATAARLLAYTEPKFYARLFQATRRNRDPLAGLLDRYLVNGPGGKPILIADGVVGLMGDVVLDGDLTYRGQGVILAMGRIIVKGNLTKNRPTDQLFLVSRGGGVTLPGGKKVEAHVQGLNMHYPDQTGTLDVTDEYPFDLSGGLAIDRLESARLRGSRNLIQYDANLSAWIFHTTFSARVFLWATSGADDSTPKETNDG